MTASKFATAAVAAAALVLAAGPAAAQQNVRTATSWPGGVHLEQFAQGFSKQVDSLTGGKVKFQVFPAGQPFHIGHGWIGAQSDPPPHALGRYDFSLAVDGVEGRESFFELSHRQDPDWGCSRCGPGFTTFRRE